MAEKPGPCEEKKCSTCCNPVKVYRFFPDEKIPKDADGKPIWVRNPEILIPENSMETKLESYTCKNLDQKTGKCLDYDNRPEMCRNTSCLDTTDPRSSDEQHSSRTSQKFIKIRTGPYEKKD